MLLDDESTLRYYLISILETIFEIVFNYLLNQVQYIFT